MKRMLFLFCLLSLPAVSIANGDTLESSCLHSMKYTVAVQVAGNAENLDKRQEYTASAYTEGAWLGIEKRGTDSMIKMSSSSEGSKKFADNYIKDQNFASAFRNSFISDCHKNPSDFIVK